MRDLPVGIRTCSVPCDGAFEATDLERLHAAGFRLAELSFNRPACGVTYDDPAKAAALRQTASELGMDLVSHAPDEFWLSNPDRAELTNTVQAVESVLLGAGAYGARAMVIHCCPKQPLLSDRVEEQLDALAYALRSLAPTCERVGVRLAAETMIPGRLTSSMDHLIDVVDRVDSPWVGICLDTNHLNLSEDVDAAVRRASSRLVEFHLNDNHFVKEEHLLPYEGAIDWSTLAQAIADIDYGGHLIMEPGGQYAQEGGILAMARGAADRLSQELAAARELRSPGV